jgi:glutamate dehydrogenase (NAD(P)+)
MSLDGATVAIQGFGNVGSVTARLLHEAGARVVAISDSRIAIHNETGLDIEAFYRRRKAGGFIGDHPVHGIDSEPREGLDHVDITNEELLTLPVDILIPAALEGQITEENAGRVQAKTIIEAANGPVTDAADTILNERGVYVVPDILANAGGVVVSYFEWVQDLQSFFWEEDEVDERLQRIMSKAFAEVAAVAQGRRLTLREAAYIVALQRVVEAIESRGIYP